MRYVLLSLFLSSSLLLAKATPEAAPERPIDPFDYNFCGGERVYPIVGVNIATACGPRNQVALGRRGKLMWFFPGQAGSADSAARQSYQGQIKLSKEQLAKFSTLAEVAKLTDPVEPTPSRVLYKMGINFSGHQPKYIYSAYSESYTPGNELLKEMLASVPATEKPYLPDCKEPPALFDPTLNQAQRNTAAMTVVTRQGEKN